jgi:hypothetical protein
MPQTSFGTDLTGQENMSIKNKILITLTILMMGASSVFFYLIYQDKKAINQKPEIITEKKAKVQKNEKTYPEDLTGKVYLTLKEKDSDKQGIYYFDLDENELVEIYTSTECEIIGGGLNSIGNKMAYSSNCEQENRDYQIFVYDLEQNNSKQITQNSREIKKEMIWSDDNSEIVFTKSNEIEEISADWLIYKTDLNGNEKFIASNSQNPFFGENKNEILASREGDFHFYNIEKDTGIRPLYSESKLLINNQFDVSDNKDKLVFLTDISGEKRIEKYGIEDWDKFKISRLAKMEVLSNEHAEWLRIQPVIGKYVIGKNTEFNSSENLKAYYLEENEQYQIADFNDKYDLIQINDWK